MSDLMKKLLAGSVKLPEEEPLTFVSTSVVDGHVRLDFGEQVLVLEPEGALQLAEILMRMAMEARKK